MSDEVQTETTQRGKGKTGKRAKRNYKSELDALTIQVGFAVAILERVSGAAAEETFDKRLVSIALEQLKK